MRVHLTNQIVDERGVRSSKNEIRGAGIVGAAEVVRLGTSQRRENFSERVDQIGVALTVGVHDNAELLERGRLLIEVVAGIYTHKTGNQRN